ncbi:MAG TPA: tetratricopeptide repeat protein [Burkholderiales bacterium]|nr:tetratricopeptide repeat protein [Burkholderiales bacterium]
MHDDARGLTTTVSDPRALEAYERALHAFQTYRGDPLAPLDEAIGLDAGFAAAYAAKALLLCSVFERRFMRDALATLEAGREALERANPRERALAEAAGTIARGRWHAGVQRLEQVLQDHPRDILALQMAHLLDFFRGDALNLRNRPARVLPAWDRSTPGAAYVLGLYAFGLEECNQYAAAEKAGREAVERSGDDAWAVHAVAHVMEMQGRVAEGLAWYEDTRAVWNGADNGFAYHNAWHTALFRMDGGDYGAALKVWDERFAAGTETALARVDATALLWRLMLEGVDVQSRFAGVADAWERTLEDEGGFYAFNDFHATLALAAARRRDVLERVRKALARGEKEAGANADMTRLVARGACEAAIDYCEGRYAAASERLVAVRDGASRFGGSHAQRDLLTLTLIDAAQRAGLAGLARHYLNERLVARPGGAWGERLARRIG